MLMIINYYKYNSQITITSIPPSHLGLHNPHFMNYIMIHKINHMQNKCPKRKQLRVGMTFPFQNVKNQTLKHLTMLQPLFCILPTFTLQQGLVKFIIASTERQ